MEPQVQDALNGIAVQMALIVTLLSEVRDALCDVPEPVDQDELTCRCTIPGNGMPIANCPICGGTGQA